MNRTDTLFLIYQSVKNRVQLSFDDFVQAVMDWEVIPVVQRDKLFGGVIVKGNEIHVGFAEKPTASIRGNIKAVLNPLLEKHGFVITAVKNDNINGLNFCKRLGFVETGRDSDKISLRCDGSHYV
jgi:hypothetical protein